MQISVYTKWILNIFHYFIFAETQLKISVAIEKASDRSTKMDYKIVVIGLLCGLCIVYAQNSGNVEENNQRTNIRNFMLRNIMKMIANYDKPCEGECSESFIGLFFCEKIDLNAYCPNDGSCCISNGGETTAQMPDPPSNSEESKIRTNMKQWRQQHPQWFRLAIFGDIKMNKINKNKQFLSIQFKVIF